MGVEDGRKTSGASAFGRRTDKRLVKQVKYILLSTLIKILGFYKIPQKIRGFPQIIQGFHNSR